MFISLQHFPRRLWKSKRIQAVVCRRNILLVAVGLLLSSEVYAQTATLRGFVSDQSNGESLPGANVSLRDAAGDLFGAAANNDGFYAIGRLVPGEYVVVVSFVGFTSHVDTLRFARDEIHSYNVALAPDTEELGEVVVDAERTAGAARVLAGLQTVLPAEIDRIPV